jgi:hypothetical protein
MDNPAAQGTWLAWGVGVPADLSDGYLFTNISVYNEDLIAKIRQQDPEWPPPNDNVEDPDDLNDSWATEVSGITEQEVQEEVSMYPDEVRGVFRLRYSATRATCPFDPNQGQRGPAVAAQAGDSGLRRIALHV